ncbi:histone-lysine N-methyltransferase CLF [Cryptomeria japonica]|uniref:histone-lysine N-methyltransferase CLF n=1 Tax=Cryptomeria japonica TaxID=3369 RepID=UPI0027DA4610|nr:histone-lysine N-methyltransferase CLF [Cryptomeria japonica]XP_057821618.2 histone-lysine N-methyltransferase CLF [Cryptomeria japonica]
MSTKNMGFVSGSRSSSKADTKECQVNEEAELVTQSSGSLSSTIQRLKKEISADRHVYVKERIDLNKRNLELYTANLLSLSKSRKVTSSIGKEETKDILTCRMEKAPCKFSLDLTAGEKENINFQEEGSNASSIVGSCGGKTGVRPIKLHEVQKIPPYTTWIFLDRNQRMTEDQSVLGRRRIYYDPNGNEALICSDSEEEAGDEDEDKPEFSEGDDRLLRMGIQEHGLSQAILDSLCQVVEVKPNEIQARYEYLIQQSQHSELEGKGSGVDNIASDCIFLGKDLDAAMDSFENLFCRRCLVFDCRLHGCSQDLVYPSEKQPPWTPPEEESNIPCSIHCYRLQTKVEEISSPNLLADVDDTKTILPASKDRNKLSSRKKGLATAGAKTPKSVKTESGRLDEKPIADSSIGEPDLAKDCSEPQHLETPQKRKHERKIVGNSKKNNKRVAERVLVSMRKRQKRMVTETSTIASGFVSPSGIHLRSNSGKGVDNTQKSLQKNNKNSVGKKSLRKRSSTKKSDSNADDFIKPEDDVQPIIHGDFEETEEQGATCKQQGTLDIGVKQEDCGWSSVEKGLYAKGVEIFGRNSCLISRNLLNGLKTCSEIAEYIRSNEFLIHVVGDGLNSRSDGNGKADGGDAIGTEARTRTRFWRRRGKVRRLKYTWKSAVHPSIRKRIADSKDQPCKQYTPCNCQSTCGKQCPCLHSGTCCEKYCGCSKGCKNRFRGCHCAKSQCRSRQCPCFAAGRECDPDVCRNCWVGCGDGTLGGPPPRGDNYECRNMKLLLKQQQRVLLGRSDVSGWGAFLKNSVNKHDYLGEYTGELISHREADKRGKIYDRENSSFLFNLNDQYVLDAYRKGDKLKFANHSPTPNCYAKVIMVAGDHRVGIFAKERIQGGEELFYDYRYEPDRAPVWARKPECPNSRREETTTSHGRAKKVA